MAAKRDRVKVHVRVCLPCGGVCEGLCLGLIETLWYGYYISSYRTVALIYIQQYVKLVNNNVGTNKLITTFIDLRSTSNK